MTGWKRSSSDGSRWSRCLRPCPAHPCVGSFCISVPNVALLPSYTAAQESSGFVESWVTPTETDRQTDRVLVRPPATCPSTQGRAWDRRQLLSLASGRTLSDTTTTPVPAQEAGDGSSLPTAAEDPPACVAPTAGSLQSSQGGCVHTCECGRTCVRAHGCGRVCVRARECGRVCVPACEQGRKCACS